jgi:hypothetical protein
MQPFTSAGIRLGHEAMDGLEVHGPPRLRKRAPKPL